MKCTFCQSNVENEMVFCPFCGNKLDYPSKKDQNKEFPQKNQSFPVLPNNHVNYTEARNNRNLPNESLIPNSNFQVNPNKADSKKENRHIGRNRFFCSCIIIGLLFALSFMEPNQSNNLSQTTSTSFGSIIRYENLVIDQQKEISFYLYAGQAICTIEYNPNPHEINGTIYSGNVAVANYHYGDESNFTIAYCYSTRDGSNYHETTHTWELKSDYLQIINLTITLYSTEDIYEENDDMAHAYEYKGGLPGLKYNDEDWYKINITQATGSRVGLYSNSQFYLKIYNENGTIIAQTPTGTESMAEMQRGFYYIQVCSNSGFNGQDYSLI